MEKQDILDFINKELNDGASHIQQFTLSHLYLYLQTLEN